MLRNFIKTEFLSAKNRLNKHQRWLHTYLFERTSKGGRIFEYLLLIAIFLSIAIVMLESVESIAADYGNLLFILEWVFTVFFSVEYILRLYSAYRPIKYATSFFGVIDLLSVLPTFISAFVPGAHAFFIIRILRVFRIFRIFKLIKFSRAGLTILTALKASREKILMFLLFVLTLVIITGSLMYLIEGESNSGFTSIPRSIYWAIVTLTTVGYGDIAPKTVLGQFFAALIMLLGYAVIAVPTGIVSAEFAQTKIPKPTQTCSRCGKAGHETASRFCNRCGERLIIES